MSKGFTIKCENCGAESTFRNWDDYLKADFSICAYDNYNRHDYEIYCSKCDSEVELK